MRNASLIFPTPVWWGGGKGIVSECFKSSNKFGLAASLSHVGKFYLYPTFTHSTPLASLLTQLQVAVSVVDVKSLS